MTYNVVTILEFAHEIRGAAYCLNNLAITGPDLRINAHKKTLQEAAELANEPASIEEWADVVICLVAVALQNGWTVDELTKALRAKNDTNIARKWQRNPDDTYQHVREDEHDKR